MSKDLTDQSVEVKIYDAPKPSNTSDLADVCEDCAMPANRSSIKSRPSSQPSNGMCVTCPFCQKLVNAIVTAKQISCPACLTSVAITS